MRLLSALLDVVLLPAKVLEDVKDVMCGEEPSIIHTRHQVERIEDDLTRSDP